MKKRILSLLLALVMLVMMVPALGITANAVAENIMISDATYYSSGSLNSLKTTFEWYTADAVSRLALTTKLLPENELTNWGDSYGWINKFHTFEEALEYDATNGDFGFIRYSEEKEVLWGTNSMSISFAETDILLTENKTYYVYQWTTWENNCYPDSLMAAVRVQDGVLQYTDSEDGAHYDSNAFENVTSSTFSVSVTGATGMTPGSASQSGLTGAMTPIVFTVAAGYYFPESYAVESLNGITVTRDSEKQITVSGTPTADTELALPAPSVKNNGFEEFTFNYAYNVTKDSLMDTMIKGGEYTAYGLDWPFKPISGKFDTTEGAWKLTYEGPYGYVKNTSAYSKHLHTQVKYAVQCSPVEITEDSVAVHNLTKDGVHVAYGVVYAYDPAQNLVLFIGYPIREGNINGNPNRAYILSMEELNSNPNSTVGKFKTMNTTIIYSDLVQYHAISVDSVENGQISVSENSALMGKTITVTATADTGYVLKSVQYNDGTDHTITPVNGVYSFPMPHSNVTVSATFAKTYTVTYMADGVQVGQTQIVVHGENATPPAIPSKTGHTDTPPTWEHDGTNITADTVINAVYTPNKYKVEFWADGKRIGDTQYISYGQNAEVPAVPEKEGYNGIWNHNGQNITNKLNIYAQYTIKTYTVTYMADGVQVGEVQTVKHGENATAPRIPAKTDYTAKWEHNGKNITADTVINAIYTPKYCYVVFMADGVMQGEAVRVDYGKDVTLPEVPAKEGHTGVWNHDGKNITENITINAVYTPESYTVTYMIDGVQAGEVQTVLYGQDAVAPALPEKTGYNGSWDHDGKNITGNMTINAVYTIKTFTVTYLVDGAQIGEPQIIEYGKDAVVPQVPEKTGFTGTWDNDGKNITADKVINAVYTGNIYRVVFTTDIEQVGEVQYIEHGKDAVVPAVPVRPGYEGEWSHNGKNVTSHLTIHAVYTPARYTVTYMADGVQVGEVQTVGYGQNATAPAVPEKSGFIGAWSHDGKNITEDTVINAVYATEMFEVTYEADGNVVGQVQHIPYGQNAVAPELPEKAGYTGCWNHDGKNITSDLVINAVYTAKTYRVTYEADGVVVGQVQTVLHGQNAVAPEIPQKLGHTASWSHDGKNITEDMTIQAVYVVCGMLKDVTTDGEGAKISGSVSQVEAALPMTQDEKDAILLGRDISYWLEVTQLTPTDTEKNLVKDVLSGEKAGAYLDISMFKQVGHGEIQKMGVLNGKVTVTVDLPESLRNTDPKISRSYSVVRIHGSFAEKLAVAFDAQSNTLTFDTDRFSTYCIAYSDQKAQGGQGNQQGQGSQQGQSNQQGQSGQQNQSGILPVTGDTGAVLLWSGVAVAALAGVVLLIMRKRKYA